MGEERDLANILPEPVSFPEELHVTTTFEAANNFALISSKNNVRIL